MNSGRCCGNQFVISATIVIVPSLLILKTPLNDEGDRFDGPAPLKSTYGSPSRKATSIAPQIQPASCQRNETRPWTTGVAHPSATVTTEEESPIAAVNPSPA